MKGLKLFAGAALALMPLPALADSTAHYLLAGKLEMTVETATGGNSRIDIANKVSIIRKDGVDYVVLQDKTAPKTFELKAVVDLAKGALASEKPPTGPAPVTFELAAGQAATIASRPGSGWVLRIAQGTEEDRKKHIEFVVSADPALAPTGAAFRGVVDTVMDLLSSQLPPNIGLRERLGDILDKGTLLRVLPVEDGATKPEGPVLELTAFDTATVAPARFALPGPVSTPEELGGLMGAMTGGSGAEIQPLP